MQDTIDNEFIQHDSLVENATLEVGEHKPSQFDLTGGIRYTSTSGAELQSTNYYQSISPYDEHIQINLYTFSTSNQLS